MSSRKTGASFLIFKAQHENLRLSKDKTQPLGAARKAISNNDKRAGSRGSIQ